MARKSISSLRCRCRPTQSGQSLHHCLQHKETQPLRAHSGVYSRITCRPLSEPHCAAYKPPSGSLAWHWLRLQRPSCPTATAAWVSDTTRRLSQAQRAGQQRHWPSSPLLMEADAACHFAAAHLLRSRKSLTGYVCRAALLFLSPLALERRISGPGHMRVTQLQQAPACTKATFARLSS